MLTYNNFDIETTDWIDAQCPVYEKEVVEIFKESVEVGFENILIGLRFEKLKDYVLRQYPNIIETDCYLNSRDSHFYVQDGDGDLVEVRSYEEIEEIDYKIGEQA